MINLLSRSYLKSSFNFFSLIAKLSSSSSSSHIIRDRETILSSEFNRFFRDYTRSTTLICVKSTLEYIWLWKQELHNGFGNEAFKVKMRSFLPVET